MKYLSLIIALFFFGASSTAAELVNIHIQVAGLSSGTVYLVDVFKNKQSSVDSARVEVGGNIYFKREKLFDPGEYTAILPDGGQIQILMDDDQVFSLKTSADDLIGNMQVTGSMENTLLYETAQFDFSNKTKFDALQQEIQMLADQGQDYSKQQAQLLLLIQVRNDFYNSRFQQYPHALFFAMKQAEQIPTIDDVRLPDGSVDYPAQRRLLRDHFWDLVDFNDTRLLRTKVIFNKLIAYLDELTPPQTSAVTRSIDLLLDRVLEKPEYYRFFSEWLAQDYRAPEGPFMDPEAIYIYMVNNYLTYERAFWADSVQVYAWRLRMEDKTQSLMGKKGQNIEALNPQGDTTALYDIKSPYIALFFYHAECDHCKAEAPKLVQFYREWQDKGVEVFAVAMGTEDAEWKTFIEEYKMDWVNVTDKDTRGIYKNYSVPGTPEIYLLNPDRVIIGKHLRTAHLPGMIEHDQVGRTSLGQQ